MPEFEDAGCANGIASKAKGEFRSPASHPELVHNSGIASVTDHSQRHFNSASLVSRQSVIVFRCSTEYRRETHHRGEVCLGYCPETNNVTSRQFDGYELY